MPFVKMICRFVPEWFAGVIECHQLALLAVLANLTAERYSREGEMILYSSSGSTSPSPVLCVCGKTLWHRTANHSGKGQHTRKTQVSIAQNSGTIYTSVQISGQNPWRFQVIYHLVRYILAILYGTYYTVCVPYSFPSTNARGERHHA